MAGDSTLYLFKVLEMSPKQHLHLSKWPFPGNGQCPEDVYIVQGNYCNCPAHVPFCKHLKWVKLFREANIDMNGLVLDENANTFTYFMGAKGNFT